ncbi:hypothetical protein N7476_001564 [Penicillium atrosanguineum]|uniref:VWFA domain-containing protein n=1 Tax=Penicillium atrosanguineum TaxID=1132637 RepID=A0A9W9QDN9_9EURO|nr:hypothetical protein N7476_001564 [Penicillium atrosanguineum]
MSFFERKAPPPLWSSFPASRPGHRHRKRAEAITPDFTMGNNNSTQSPSPTGSKSKPKRNSTFFSICRGSKKPTNVWDPPAYDDQDYKAPSAQVKTSTDADSDSRYSFLKDFDTIFLVDDSSSMSGPRWREAEEAIAAIAPICTQYDSDGIDVHFLNHRTSGKAGSYHNITTAADVQEIFHSVRPCGSTPVGRRLLEILTPYLRRVEQMQSGNAVFVKPINIITITDGEFTDDAESVIVQVAKTLDNPRVNALPWQVGIQFFQIGNDASVRRYLQELDDDLGKSCRDGKLRDIVDTVPWRGKQGRTLDADGILKCVLGAVNKKLDRRQA